MLHSSVCKPCLDAKKLQEKTTNIEIFSGSSVGLEKAKNPHGKCNY